MASSVTIDLDGPVGVVELHRPPNNWFDIEALAEVADAWERLGDDPACRAIVFCTEGKNFCAGADMSGTDVVDNTADLYAQAVRMAGAKVPVVAAVQGAAVGGGLGLAMIADLRVGTPETRFSCNFSKIGFHQGFGLTVTLPAAIGEQRALELMYTGGQVRGPEGLEWGFASRVVPEPELRPTALALASEIAACGPLAVRAIKETMRGDLPERVRAATVREGEQQRILRATDDFREGVAAMADRRTPNFTGR
jgi:enoyl-CoA hydratase/carnithine racemase